jgi:hypothetical protein
MSDWTFDSLLLCLLSDGVLEFGGEGTFDLDELCLAMDGFRFAVLGRSLLFGHLIIEMIEYIGRVDIASLIRIKS